MLEFKTRLVAASLALLAGSSLVGCSPTKDGPQDPAPASKITVAKFDLVAGYLPFPTDLFFSGSTDGSLNVPAMAFRPASNQNALNALDGFSTSATMVTSYSAAIDGATLSGSTVRIVELYLSNTTKAPAQGAELPGGVSSPVIRVLAYGTDYTADVSPDADSAGKVLRITPLKPLRPSTGATNIGYLVILTNGVHAADGKATEPDTTYATIKSAPADCSGITDATLNAVCRLTKAHLAIAGAIGTAAADVTLTWSFSTQNTSDTLGYLAAVVPAQAITVVATGLNTHNVSASLAGKANIYVGKTTVPYYSAVPANTHDSVILSTFWNAAGAPPAGLDPTSRNLTRFNPIPAKVVDLDIPVLVTVPNASAAGGACVKPVAGWPVVIVQHGLGGDRTQALAVADSFADACFVVAAIDHPLHGITSTLNPLYCSASNAACMGARERTFDIDLVNNTTGATVAGGDGVIDASATHWINLSSGRTFRDTLRQGEADLVVFSKTVANIDLDGGGADIDATRIHYVGLSLGGIMGSAFVKFAPVIRTATVSVPGGVITQLGLDSPTFGPRIRAGLGAQGLADNTYVFNVFFRDAQTVIDSGDPINHIFGAQARHPLHLTKVVGDTVVPNNSTDRLIVAGALTKRSSGTNAVAAGAGVYTTFIAGSHGSLFDPTSSVATTVEMQREAVLFAASATAPGGPFLTITNTAVIQP